MNYEVILPHDEDGPQTKIHTFDGIVLDHPPQIQSHPDTDQNQQQTSFKPYRYKLAFLSLLLACILQNIEGYFTSYTTRYAFSPEANALPALRDMFHPNTNHTPICDQTGAGVDCPDWLRPLANKGPDR
tara:strand:+ start:867 stop:1253 length:387 start_codon:yes stop_codon:yes gene_type:complete